MEIAYRTQYCNTNAVSDLDVFVVSCRFLAIPMPPGRYCACATRALPILSIVLAVFRFLCSEETNKPANSNNHTCQLPPLTQSQASPAKAWECVWAPVRQRLFDNQAVDLMVELTLSAPLLLNTRTLLPWSSICRFNASGSLDSSASPPGVGVAMSLLFLAGCWGSVGPSAFFFCRAMVSHWSHVHVLQHAHHPLTL